MPWWGKQFSPIPCFLGHPSKWHHSLSEITFTLFFFFQYKGDWISRVATAILLSKIEANKQKSPWVFSEGKETEEMIQVELPGAFTPIPDTWVRQRAGNCQVVLNCSQPFHWQENKNDIRQTNPWKISIERSKWVFFFVSWSFFRWQINKMH